MSRPPTALLLHGLLALGLLASPAPARDPHGGPVAEARAVRRQILASLHRGDWPPPGNPILEVLRATLETAVQLPFEEGYKVLERDLARILDRPPAPIHVGVRTPLRAALLGAREVSTYPGGFRILAETIRVCIEETAALVGPRPAAFRRILALGREVAEGQSDLDAWLTLYRYPEALGDEPTLQPHPYLGLACMAARDGSVHASYADGRAILVKASLELEAASCDPRVAYPRTALRAAGVASAQKARFWTLLQFGDHLHRSPLAHPTDKEILERAVPGAWASQTFEEGIALLEPVFRQMLVDGEGTTVP